MTVGTDSLVALRSAGLVSHLPGASPSQARDMDTTHVEEGKSYSLQPGLGRGSMLVGTQALTFEPVVRVTLALTVLIWKRNSRSVRLLSHCPTANAACAHPQLCSGGTNLDLVWAPGGLWPGTE